MRNTITTKGATQDLSGALEAARGAGAGAIARTRAMWPGSPWSWWKARRVTRSFSQFQQSLPRRCTIIHCRDLRGRPTQTLTRATRATSLSRCAGASITVVPAVRSCAESARRRRRCDHFQSLGTRSELQVDRYDTSLCLLFSPSTPAMSASAFLAFLVMPNASTYALVMLRRCEG